jgi:hypothetical protein
VQIRRAPHQELARKRRVRLLTALRTEREVIVYTRGHLSLQLLHRPADKGDPILAGCATSVEWAGGGEGAIRARGDRGAFITDSFITGSGSCGIWVDPMGNTPTASRPAR